MNDAFRTSAYSIRASYRILIDNFKYDKALSFSR